MRRFVLCTLALSLLLPTTALAANHPQAHPSFSGGQFQGEGFDKCQAPSSSALRSWLTSPYRAVNIYFAGNNRACANQPELSTQWLTTVTSNGWSVIPTYVGSQAACTSSNKTHKISASTAATQGTQEADDAATQMAALGLGPSAGNPVYFDMEPYSRTNTTCDNAVMTFLDAWSRELHVQGYVAGVYGTISKNNGVIYSLAQRQADTTFQEPDAIWYADWNSVDSTDDQSTLTSFWKGHVIHQYRGGHNETFNGATFNIDNDALAGDVVAAVTPTPPSGPPYSYAAAPPSGSVLREHSTPTKGTDSRTGVTYPSGTALSVTCQIIGDAVDGSPVWDQLSDGAYVSDIFTTTTGGLSFTVGLPRCDTTPPVATMSTLPAATLRASKTVSWSGTDDASGVASYDVRYRTSGWNADLGGFHRLETATSLTSASVALATGTRYCYEVRATDGSGNTGAWSQDACIARALDDRSLSGGAAWRRLTGRPYFLHTATATHDSSVTLRLPDAHVSLVGVVATTGPGAGSVDVFVNRRKIGTVTLTATSHAERQMFLLPAFPARVGNIRVKTTSDNALVRLDGLVVSG